MKKVISVLLAVIMLISMSVPTFAAEVVTVEDTELITVRECYLAGQKWITANYEDDTVISSIIPVKDLYDNINGYCINFSVDGKPNGYLLLNAAKYSQSYIREFAFSGQGIYEQLLEESNITTTTDVAIYSTNPFEYALKYNESGTVKIYNCDETVMSIDAAKAVYVVSSSAYEVQTVDTRSSDDKEEYYDSFFYGTALTSYTDANDKVIPGADEFTPYKMSELRTGTNTGNCGPTAATNLVALYHSKGKTNILENGDIDDTYAALVTAVGFAENGTDGTYYSNLKSGVQSYVRGKSYSITLNDYLLDTWANFKNDFDANKSNIIFIEGNKQDEGGNWITVGHFVIGVGYRIMNDGTRYIRIYDGWNKSNDRFLHFDADSITTFKGTSVTIS